MKPSGVIYDSKRGQWRGEIRISLPLWLWMLYKSLSVAGTGMVVAGLAGLVFLFSPIIKEELAYRLSSRDNITKLGVLVDQAKAEAEYRTFVEAKARALNAPNTSFSVIVPKINARASVIANVQTADPKAYDAALKQGIAHAAGTVFPGMEGTTFLFAHSSDSGLTASRYNAIFYLLRELEPGDEVYVFFMDKFYAYRVTEKKVVEPADVSWIANAQSTPEQLVLQTCWPPGTSLKRLIVIAEPIKAQ